MKQCLLRTQQSSNNRSHKLKFQENQFIQTEAYMIKKFYILSIGIASLSREMKSLIGLHFSEIQFFCILILLIRDTSAISWKSSSFYGKSAKMAHIKNKDTKKNTKHARRVKKGPSQETSSERGTISSAPIQPKVSNR